MTLAETGDLMALIVEEHPKFLDTPDPDKRHGLWASALSAVPYELAEAVIMRLLAESPYAPKLCDVAKGVKDALTAAIPPDGWPVTDWEVRSMIRLRTSLEMPIPPEYAKLAKQRGTPVPASAMTGSQAGDAQQKGREQRGLQ